MATISAGIFQGDVIVQTAIQEGLDDLRRNPWLVDYLFASLTQDPLTVKRYGKAQVDEARRWISSVEVPVFTNTVQAAQLPAVTIAMVESAEVESEATLADVHHDPTEPLDQDVPLAGPFSPRSWDPASGLMVLPDAVVDHLYLSAGMAVADSVGARHEVLEVLGDATVRLRSDGSALDFSAASVRPRRPAFAVHLESSSFRESYTLGCHAGAPPLYLLFLHSAVVFVLLRYKQSLLEARGFERTTISSSDFARNQSFENEVGYSRYVTLSGRVRQHWPKDVSRTLQSIESRTKVLGLDHAVEESLVLGTEDELPSK